MHKSQARRKKNRKKALTQAGRANAGSLNEPIFDRLLDHYLVLLLFLALISLTLLSADTPLLVGLLGMMLSVAGIAQGAAKIDLWVLIPLIIYQVFSIISLCMAYNDISISIVVNFVSTQAFYPVIYLLMAFLGGHERLWLKRLCVLWAGVWAVAGLPQFLTRALAGRPDRLGGVFGNPNALGIYLVIAWFILRSCVSEEDRDVRLLWLTRLEPLLLTVLALTLSMGSFVSMAAGILFLVCTELRRGKSWRKALSFACDLLARASLGIGLGVLMYAVARRGGQPWLCLPLIFYLAALCLYWDRFRAFLRDVPQAAAVISVLGVLVAIVVVLIRPSSIATFQERLAMMRNGMSYLPVHPLRGLGPYQWRVWNLLDSDTYFNTYHIHNVLLHIGVELGLPAMAMAAAVLVRRFWKKGEPNSKAGFTAFVVHNLIDTSFFYTGITATALMVVSEPASCGKRLPAAAVKAIFAVYAAFFAAHAFYSLVPI